VRDLRGVLSRKGTDRDHHDGGRGRNGNGFGLGSKQPLPNKASRFSVVKLAVRSLCIEHSITADMADGRPLPPLIKDGVVWHVVSRTNGRTTWRRIFLSPSLVTAWRAASGDQTQAP
jgi:hypothetical protein